MEDKYYVPELQELHVDFPYEEIRNGEWVKINDFSNAYDYEDSCLYGFIKALEAGKIRVKYLDAEDIVECGLKQYYPDDYNHGLVFKTTSKVIRGEEREVIIIYIPNTRHLLVSVDARNDYKDGRDITLYAGQCKNKSKLKQILKDLGI